LQLRFVQQAWAVSVDYFMKPIKAIASFAVALAFSASGQVTNMLPGRTIVRMLPDYLHPVVYALNEGSGTNSGTLLALNPTNGAVLNEIQMDLQPTDMAMTGLGDSN